MTNFPNAHLNQKAVYWAPTGPNTYGEMQYDAGEEIKCRWEINKELVLQNDGKEVISNAQVQIKKDLDEDGMMYLGEITELDSDQVGDPRKVDGAYNIKQIHKITSIDDLRYFRKVYLSWLK